MFVGWFFCLFVNRDLSAQGAIQAVILDSFSSPNEEVKSAASYALGQCTVATSPKLSLITCSIHCSSHLLRANAYNIEEGTMDLHVQYIYIYSCIVSIEMFSIDRMELY